MEESKIKIIPSLVATNNNINKNKKIFVLIFTTPILFIIFSNVKTMQHAFALNFYIFLYSISVNSPDLTTDLKLFKWSVGLILSSKISGKAQTLLKFL